MSLLVQGAKLPTVEGDKSIKAEIRCIGGKWEFGIMTGGYYCCQQWSFYPISELPPHGRCIDADARVNVQMYNDEFEDYQTVNMSIDDLLDSSWIELEDDPTIIPAEGCET